MSEPARFERTGHYPRRWVAMGGFASVVIGLLAGLLAWIGGESLALAILAGGAACGGSMNLALVLIKALGSMRSR